MTNLKELGLACALELGRYLFGTDDLHYGYWPSGLSVKVSNLRRAQELHSELLLAHVPQGTRSILDVGCGAGRLAARLVSKGYEVDGLSPNHYLGERARALLGQTAHIYDSTLETFDPPRRYDLLLFSESFQYVPLEQAVPKIQSCLSPHGHLLIVDFFRNGAPGKSPIGGGHVFEKATSALAGGFELLQDLDLTREMAPNIDLLGGFFTSVGKPVYDLIWQYGQSRHPIATRLLKWRFRKRLEKFEWQFFTDEMNGTTFARFKTYRLLLYRARG